MKHYQRLIFQRLFVGPKASPAVLNGGKRTQSALQPRNGPAKMTYEGNNTKMAPKQSASPNAAAGK